MPRGEGILTIVNNIRRVGKNNAVHSLTFCGVNITKEQRAALEKKLAEGFNLFWDSWVEPELKKLEAKVPKKKVAE